MNRNHSDDISWKADGRSRLFHSSQLAQRWQQLAPGARFTIAEAGFGSGVDFLTAWQSWLEHAPTDATLHFISTEQYPLSPYDLRRIWLQWPELAHLSRQLSDQYPPISARGFHRLRFANVQLTLIFAEVTDGFAQLLPISAPGANVAEIDCGWGPFASTRGLVDAWFLNDIASQNDGVSQKEGASAKKTQAKHQSLFEVIARLSRPNATLTSLTANDSVRRGLQNVGFEIHQAAASEYQPAPLRGRFLRAQGYVEQAEMPSSLHATTKNIHATTKNIHATANNVEATAANTRPGRRKPSASWHLCSQTLPPTDRVAVIGAGLAGCHSAYALAEKGFNVTLIDRGSIASGASGNPLGVVYSKLSSSPGTFADFNLAAFTYALRFYKQQGLFDRCGDACGVLQLPEGAERIEQQKAVAVLFAQSPELVQWLDRYSASTVAGITLTTSGLWLPSAGWLDPPLLCRTLADHPNIRVLEHSSVHKLEHLDGEWQLLDEGGSQITCSPAVVVACAESARRFMQCMRLPSKAIRGQISLARARTQSERLQTVLCGEGYIAPARRGRHCLGASFNLTSQAAGNLWDEHLSNLRQVRALAPGLAELDVAELNDGRASMRCTTPDYLPIVGPVANEDAVLVRFARYRKNARAVVDAPGEYWPGLFINVGHGSKGLTYTPLCAELLACMITNEPLPISRDLALHLHAARFLVRDLARRRL